MGELKQNYTRIWNPIAEAMSKANLTGSQFRLCWAIWRLTYSWHRTETEASYQVLASETGMNPKKIGAPLDGLIAANIIIEVRRRSFIGAGIYKFNKDIRTWAPEAMDLSLISETNLAIVAEECDGKSTSPHDSTSPQDGDSPQSGTSPETRGEASPQSGGEVPAGKARSDGASEIPKERSKEKISFPPISPPGEQLEPQTVDEVLVKFPRYSPGDQSTIRDYWEVITNGRKGSKVAMSVVLREMRSWERYPVDIVIKALDIHICKYPGRREPYTGGIMRRLLAEKQIENQRGGRNRGSPDIPASSELDQYDRQLQRATLS